MEIKKGDNLKVTKFDADWDSKIMGYKDKIEYVKVDKIIRRGGKTRVYVTSEYGYGYAIIREQFEGKYGKIEIVK